MSGLKQVLILAGTVGLIGLLLWPQRDLAPSVQYALLDGEILDSIAKGISEKDNM